MGHTFKLQRIYGLYYDPDEYVVCQGTKMYFCAMLQCNMLRWFNVLWHVQEAARTIVLYVQDMLDPGHLPPNDFSMVSELSGWSPFKELVKFLVHSSKWGHCINHVEPPLSETLK